MKASVVVPTFNQAAYLPTALDWVMHQDHPDLEIIVVDGGSTDETKAFLNEFKGRAATETATFLDELVVDERGDHLVRRTVPRYPREGREIKIVTFDHDIGATPTYNEGFKRATGETCTYVVGDDIPHLSMISRLTRALRESGAGYAYADMALVDDANRILQILRKPDYSYEACFARWNHLGVAHLYRRDWHDRVGLMDPAIRSANDYEWHLRFAQAGCTFVHVPEVLYSVRWHGERRRSGQHTPENEARTMREAIEVCKRARQA